VLLYVAPTVELTWALILASASHISPEAASVRGVGWQRFLGDDMAETTIGIIEYGMLGPESRRLALRLA
jgi:phosphoglycerate dehydrogenase-like enzyme